MHQEKLGLIFKETANIKKDIREIKKQVEEALQNNKAYIDCKFDLDSKRAELRMIRAGVEEQFMDVIEKMDSLKIEADDKKMMTTDIALSKLIKGETVEVVDDFGWVYEPVWSVKFKKTGVHQDDSTGKRTNFKKQ